jgi:hypothetical protein
MSAVRGLTSFASLLLLVVCLLALGHRHGSDLALLSHVLTGDLGLDSSGCMDPAWDALHAGKPVYETVLFNHVAKFQYPISSLLIYSLASVFGVSGAVFIKAIVLLSLPATLLLCGELFLSALAGAERFTRNQRLFIRLSIFVIGLLFYPVVKAAELGQLQMLLAFLWTLTLYLWMRNRQELSGCCMALLCVVKPQFVVFLIWALLRRHWRFFIPMLALTLVTQLASIVLFGWHNEVEYLTVVSYLSHHGEVFYPNQSVNGVLQRLMNTADSLTWDALGFPPFNSVVYAGTAVSSAVFLAAGLFLPVLRRWRDSNLDIIFFGLVATVASPIAWEHHYSYFLPAAVYMMALFFARDRALPIAFQAGFLVLSIALPGLLPLAHTRWSILISYEFFAGLSLLLSLTFLADTAPAHPAGIEGSSDRIPFPAKSYSDGWGSFPEASDSSSI